MSKAHMGRQLDEYTDRMQNPNHKLDTSATVTCKQTH